MKAITAIAAALAAAPLAAEEPTAEQAEVIAAVDAFFAALRSEDKAALAGEMDPRGLIFVHNRMDPAAPKLAVVSVADHLARWVRSPSGTDELMRYDHVLVDGDMAQVWGPYAFMVEGAVVHCGINSMSLVREGGRWRIGNTSFTMEQPSECARLGAPEVPGR